MFKLSGRLTVLLMASLVTVESGPLGENDHTGSGKHHPPPTTPTTPTTTTTRPPSGWGWSTPGWQSGWGWGNTQSSGETAAIGQTSFVQGLSAEYNATNPIEVTAYSDPSEGYYADVYSENDMNANITLTVDFLTSAGGNVSTNSADASVNGPFAYFDEFANSSSHANVTGGDEVYVLTNPIAYVSLGMGSLISSSSAMITDGDNMSGGNNGWGWGGQSSGGWGSQSSGGWGSQSSGGWKKEEKNVNAIEAENAKGNQGGHTSEEKHRPPPATTTTTTSTTTTPPPQGWGWGGWSSPQQTGVNASASAVEIASNVTMEGEAGDELYIQANGTNFDFDSDTDFELELAQVLITSGTSVESADASASTNSQNIGIDLDGWVDGDLDVNDIYSVEASLTPTIVASVNYTAMGVSEFATISSGVGLVNNGGWGQGWGQQSNGWNKPSQGWNQPTQGWTQPTQGWTTSTTTSTTTPGWSKKSK